MNIKIQYAIEKIKANSTLIFAFAIVLVYLFIAIKYWNHPGYFSGMGSDSEIQRVMQQAADWYKKGSFYKSYGVGGYIHYLDTPTWIVYFLSERLKYTSLEFSFPFRLVSISITAISSFVVCLLFPKYCFSWLVMLGLVFLVFQKGFFCYSGSLEHIGYSLAIGIASVPLGYYITRLSQKKAVILAALYGIAITAFGFDFIPVSGLTLIASFLLCSTFHNPKKNLPKITTIIFVSFLSGMLLTLVVHFFHIGLVQGNLIDYLNDLVASSLARMGIKPPFKTFYYTSLRDIFPPDYSYFNTIFIPYSHLNAYAFKAEKNFLNLIFFSLFIGLGLYAFLSPFILGLNKQQRKITTISFSIAFLGTILWGIIAPYHAVFHYHLVPRHLYIFYVFLLYFAVETLANSKHLKTFIKSVLKQPAFAINILMTAGIILTYLILVISHWNYPGNYSGLGSDSELGRVIQQAVSWYHKQNFLSTYGVVPGGHYLDTPTWICYFLCEFFHYTPLDYSFPFRFVPIIFTTLALAYTSLCSSKFKYGWIVNIGLFLMLFQKGFYCYSGSLEHLGYSLAIAIAAVPLGQNLASMSQKKQIISASLYGIAVTAFAYDYIPIAGLTLVASFLLAQANISPKDKQITRTTWFVLCAFLCACILTVSSHWLHVGLASNCVFGFFQDMFASCLSRMGIKTPFCTSSYNSLIQILPKGYSYWRVIFTPYSFFTAYAFVAYLEFFIYSFYAMFGLLFAFSTILVLTLRPTTQQKKLLFVSLFLGILATILWDILAPYHAAFHYHLLPRHLYVFYVFLLYFFAKILEQTDFLYLASLLKKCWKAILQKKDLLIACFLLGIVLLVFVSNCKSLGFYSDDSHWLYLTHYSLKELTSSFASYVPGRNFMILWQYILFNIAGSQPSDLSKLHFIQSFLDGINVVLFYFLLKKLTISKFPAFWGSLLFAFYTNHGETHFWLTAISQNILSTTFILSYMLFAIKNVTTKPSFVLLALEWLCFIFAMFTYEQGLFVLLISFIFRIILSKPLSHPKYWAVFFTIYAIPSSFCLLLKLEPHILQGTSGPILTSSSLQRLNANIHSSILVSINNVWQIVLHYREYFRLLANSQRILAATASILIIVLSIAALFIKYFSNAKEKSLYQKPKTKILVCLIGISFFVLSYLPICLWYLSPRHNYLPSIGICIFIAAILDLLQSILTLPILLLVFQASVIVLFSMAIYHMIIYDLWDKRQWIESYKLRKDFYNKWNEHSFSGKESAIVLEDFPDSYNDMGFFAHENILTISYFCPNYFKKLWNYNPIYKSQGISRLHELPLMHSSTKTEHGYVVAREIKRWEQPVVLRYFPDNEIAYARCLDFHIDPTYLHTSFSNKKTQSNLFKLDIVSSIKNTSTSISKQAQEIYIPNSLIPHNLKDGNLLCFLLTAGDANSPEENAFYETRPNQASKLFIVIPLEVDFLKKTNNNPKALIKLTIFPKDSFQATKVWLYLLNKSEAKQLKVIKCASKSK